MQLRINYTTNAGDVHDVTTTPFSVMQWERKYQTKISRIADEGLGIEDLLYLAWEATKQAGTVAPFDTWAASIKTIQTVPDPDARPTVPAPSAG